MVDTGLESARRDRSIPPAHDAVIVGSGINSLVAGALLARAGWSVCILERSDRLGGAIWTAEITAPGYIHEVLSSWHPLFLASPAYPELAADLAARGVEYLNTDLPAGTLFPDGTTAFLSTSHEQNVAELERHAAGDGAAWDRTMSEFGATADLTFRLLATPPLSRHSLAVALRAWRRLGHRDALAYAGGVFSTCRDWLSETFASTEARGLLAPWALHAGLGPDAAASGFMTRLIAAALQMGGSPLPRGGGVQLVNALAGMIEDAGGTCRSGCDVQRVLVERGKALGVELTNGEQIAARRAVVCNVTPTQLYGRLLREAPVPARVVSAARAFRYGRAGMQMHFALSERPRWNGDERLGRTAVVHLTSGLDGVSCAVNEAERGLLPAEGTIVCGQPTALDPSRAPAGAWILWIQLQELPARPLGDAAGEIDVGDGTWTEELRELYADRIQARLARQITNLEDTLVARAVLSPADIEAANVNLVGGDTYSGSFAVDQNFLWRPRAELAGHSTPIARLHHIGASTFPGAGLGGVSGTLVARQLIGGRTRRRLSALRD